MFIPIFIYSYYSPGVWIQRCSGSQNVLKQVLNLFPGIAFMTWVNVFCALGMTQNLSPFVANVTFKYIQQLHGVTSR